VIDLGVVNRSGGNEIFGSRREELSLAQVIFPAACGALLFPLLPIPHPLGRRIVCDNRKVALRHFKCACLLSVDGNLVLHCSTGKDPVVKKEVNEDGRVVVSALV